MRDAKEVECVEIVKSSIGFCLGEKLRFSVKKCNLKKIIFDFDVTTSSPTLL